MKRFKVLITVGIFNTIHGGIHIFQFFQSLLLSYYSISHTEGSWLEKVMESPWMGLVWGLLGIITLYIGWNDYKRHKKHKD
jgi:hypothetical protein